MNSNSVERKRNNKKGFVKYAVIDAIGSLLLGLGLYGKFVSDAVHPLLNDSTVVLTLLVTGASIMAWGGFNLLTLLRRN